MTASQQKTFMLGVTPAEGAAVTEIKRLIELVEAAVQTLADTYGEDLHLRIEGYGLTVIRSIDAVGEYRRAPEPRSGCSGTWLPPRRVRL